MSAAPAFNETSSKLNLVDLVSSRYVPIQDSILENLSLKYMANLSSVCKQTSNLNRCSAPRWQWEKFLGMWFDDTRSFRSLQARLNIILSGHVLIDFLTEKPDFMAADPELKLGTHKQYYPELKTFLENCGYTEVSRCNFKSKYPRKTIAGMKFTTVDAGYSDSIKSNPAGLPYHCESTALQNLASWNKVYSLWPIQTLSRVTYDPYYTEHEHLDEIEPDDKALKDAGYTFKMPNHYDPEIDNALNSLRRLGDRFTYILSLPTDGITIPEMPDDVIESRTYHPSRTDINEGFIQGPILRYEYRVEDSSCPIYLDLVHRLIELTIQEFQKEPDESLRLSHIKQLDKDTSPRRSKEEEAHSESETLHSGDDCGLRSYDIEDRGYWQDVVLPASWTYYDEMVTKCLHERFDRIHRRGPLMS